MKGIKPKNSTVQSHIPIYERQRIEKLKRNAEKMNSQGVGFLANNILQQKN